MHRQAESEPYLLENYSMTQTLTAIININRLKELKSSRIITNSVKM